MGTLARIGYFNTKPHPLLQDGKRPTFRRFLLELLETKSSDMDMDATRIGEKDIAERIVSLGYCKDQRTAVKTAKTIMLGLLCASFNIFFI